MAGHGKAHHAQSDEGHSGHPVAPAAGAGTLGARYGASKRSTLEWRGRARDPGQPVAGQRCLSPWRARYSLLTRRARPSRMSQAQTRQPVLLQDYRPPAFLTPSIDLEFVLEPEATRITSRQRFERNRPGSGELVLFGEDAGTGIDRPRRGAAARRQGTGWRAIGSRWSTRRTSSPSKSPAASTPRPTRA